MKKILIVVASLNGGGAEKISLLYLKQLDPLFFHKTLFVVSGGNEIAHLIPPGTRMASSGAKGKVLQRLELARFVQANAFDIVFTSDINLAPQLSLHRQLTRSFKLVVRLAGNPVEEYRRGYFSKGRLAIYGLGVRYCQTVICQSSALMEEASAFFRLPKHRCSILRNPIDEEDINKCIHNQPSPFSPSQKIIVAAGRLHPSKGFDILIQAMNILVNLKKKELFLYLLGSDRGAERSLKELVGRLNLEENVRFIGFEKNPYIYYYHCDVFVLSSHYEASPNALVENYYLNTPLVSTDCAEIVNEIVKPHNGIIIKKNDSGDLASGIEAALMLKRGDIKNRSLPVGKVNDLFKEL
jgi:glycosyltransferase involved in cell wall biosynthesis